MKSVLLSVRPEWAAKILNGEKTIEIRKKFPKDYVGWVYIYCTKNGNDCYGMPTDLVDYRGCAIYNKFKLMPKGEKITTDDNQPRLNGKVVARFWCDKVEEIKCIHNNFAIERYITETLNVAELMVESCVSFQQMTKYLYYANGYAIHITKLEIFDKPKKLALHTHDISAIFYTKKWDRKSKCWRIGALTRAPQSWCYVEV